MDAVSSASRTVMTGSDEDMKEVYDSMAGSEAGELNVPLRLSMNFRQRSNKTSFYDRSEELSCGTFEIEYKYCN